MLLLAAALAALVQEQTFDSKHYRLIAYGGFTEGQEYVDLAEALYEKLKAHFGVEPREKGRLEIRFWLTADAFQAGGQADGVPNDRLQAGGVYWTGTKRAYFWKQPTPYSTRHLFLHELTHQFHFLAVMNNEARGPGWYTEGIAEYFAYHRWDGKKLETGLYDVVALEERVPAAVELARAGKLDYAGLVRGTVAPDYATSWALVHYLKSTPGFKTVEPKLWKTGADPAKLLLAPNPGAASAAAVKHLAALRPTWRIEYISWDQRGSEVVGQSETTASMTTRWDCTSIEALVAPAKGRAAVELRVTGGATFTLAVADGKATFGAGSVDVGAKATLRLEVEGGQVHALVDGKKIGTADEGRAAVGALVVVAGRAAFSQIKLAGK